jgi:AcrR family transcriptional regulator
MLIDAALRVMARGGVQTATTRAICAEAGMPLASFHYVFDSQHELMKELLRKVIDDAGDSERFPELTDDPYHNVEQMLLSTFEWAVEHPGEELAFHELGNYALRTEGLEDFPRFRVEHSMALIKRAFRVLGGGQPVAESVVDLQELAHLVLTFIEGTVTMLLNTKDEETCRRCIKVYAVFLVEYSRGRLPTLPGPAKT